MCAKLAIMYFSCPLHVIDFSFSLIKFVFPVLCNSKLLSVFLLLVLCLYILKFCIFLHHTDCFTYVSWGRSIPSDERTCSCTSKLDTSKIHKCSRPLDH